MKTRERRYAFIGAITALIFALPSCILIPPPKNEYKRFEGKEAILKEDQSLYESNPGFIIGDTDEPYVIANPNRYGSIRSWPLRAGTKVFFEDFKHIRTLTFDGWVALGHVEAGGKRRDFEFDSDFSLLKLQEE
jgi:hypothetical protein